MLLHDASLAMKAKRAFGLHHATDVRPELPATASGIACQITIRTHNNLRYAEREVDAACAGGSKNRWVGRETFSLTDIWAELM